MNKTFHKEKLMLWIMICAYIAVFGFISMMRHYQFQTQAWDMGIFDQTLWNTAHGNIMQNSLEELPNHLGVHMSPWLFVFVPDYLLFPSPYYLLLVQTVTLALGALPLFLLAKRLLRSEQWALLLAAGYLLYPSLHWVNLFDFHAVAFFIPFLITAFYFVEEGSWAWGAVFFALAASTKENAILGVLFVGIFLFVRAFLYRKKDAAESERNLLRERLWVFIIITCSFVYFIITIKVLMPAFGGGLLRLDRYAQFGTTGGEVIKNIVTHPVLVLTTVFTLSKISYLFWVFLPVLFLPFFVPSTLLMALPGLLQNLLTSYTSQFAGLYQYDALLIPAVWVGAVFGFAFVFRRRPQLSQSLQWAFVGAVLLAFLFRSPVSPFIFDASLFRSTAKTEAYRLMVRRVPDHVSVSAQTNIVPHVSHREQVYMLGTELAPVDVLLVDTSDLFGFEGAEEFGAYISGYLQLGQYAIEQVDDTRAIIYKKDIQLIDL